MSPAVKIPQALKDKLDGLKVHPRQPYSEVIEKGAVALTAIEFVWDQIPETEKQKKLPPELIKQADFYFSHKSMI